MLVITETFTEKHKNRIEETSLEEAKAFLKTDRDMHNALGILYAPIISKEWDYKSTTFCGGELSDDDVLRLAFFFVKAHYDGDTMIEGSAEKVTELHAVHFE